MTENLNDKIIIYQSEDGKTQLDVKLEGETVWLTQAQMVELFQSSKATISEHIKHIIEDDELDSNSRGCVKIDTSSFCSSFTLSTT